EGIAILLRTAVASGEAAPAGAGWGGDRFAVYLRGGGRLLAWITDWDTDAAAARFQAAAARLGARWTAVRAAPRRGPLPPRRPAAGPRAARRAVRSRAAARPGGSCRGPRRAAGQPRHRSGAARTPRRPCRRRTRKTRHAGAAATGDASVRVAPAARALSGRV